MPSVYLAGPEVFFDTLTRDSITQRKKSILQDFGLNGVAPMDNEAELSGSFQNQARTIYRSNKTIMDTTDAIIANLTPFRGPSADAGTVFEVGYMVALGRPAAGFTVCKTAYRDRVRSGFSEDHQGAAIEPFGLGDNLMIDCALLDSGGNLFRGHEPYRDEGFSPGEFFDENAFKEAAAVIAEQL